MTLSSRKRRVLAAATCALAMAPSLAACSGSSASDSKTLTYWSMWTKNEPQAKVLSKTAAAFEKSTGIHVDIKWVGRTVLTNVSANLNGGTLPDLVDQDAGEAQGHLRRSQRGHRAQEAVRRTDHRRAEDRVQRPAHLRDGPLPDRQRRADDDPLRAGRLLPCGSTATKLKDMAAQPARYLGPGFMGVLDKEKSAGRPPLALDGDTGQYTSYWWTYSGVRHAGVGAIRDAVADKTGKSWDNSDLLAAAKDPRDPGEGWLLHPELHRHEVAGAGQFLVADGDSKSNFLLMGSWAPSETSPFAKKNPTSFEYRSLRYPTVEGGKGNDAVEESLIGFAIPSKADNPQNAEKFIRFFLNKKYLSGISSTALNLTPRQDIEVPPQLADLKKQVADAGTNTFQTDDGVTAEFPQFGTESDYPLVQKFLDGRMSAEEFIAAMKDATVKYWENQG